MACRHSALCSSYSWPCYDSAGQECFVCGLLADTAPCVLATAGRVMTPQARDCCVCGLQTQRPVL